MYGMRLPVPDELMYNLFPRRSSDELARLRPVAPLRLMNIHPYIVMGRWSDELRSHEMVVQLGYHANNDQRFIKI